MGKLAGVNASGNTLFIEGTDFSIVVKKPEVSDTWYDDLREMLVGDTSFVPSRSVSRKYETVDGVWRLC